MKNIFSKKVQIICLFLFSNFIIMITSVFQVMSVESFLCYLLGIDNLIIDPAKFDLFMEMDKPLAHYFISSSHNTYLTG